MPSAPPPFLTDGTDLAVGAALALATRGEPTIRHIPPPTDAPYRSCRRALALASFAAIDGDPDNTAEDDVHEALVIAHERGYRPTVVECLETLAALTNDRVTWSRLLGATTRAREQMGIAFRWPHLVHLLGDRLTDTDTDDFSAGYQLDLDGAVELARRTPGQRRRPTHGWSSLTQPNESSSTSSPPATPTRRSPNTS